MVSSTGELTTLPLALCSALLAVRIWGCGSMRASVAASGVLVGFPFSFMAAGISGSRDCLCFATNINLKLT